MALEATIIVDPRECANDAPNLVPNPDFDINTTGWSMVNTTGWTSPTLARSTLWSPKLIASGRVTGTKDATATQRQLQASTATGASGMPVAPDTRYIASLTANVVDASGSGIVINIDWYNAAGAYISSDASLANIQTGTGVKLLTLTATSPPTGAFAAIGPLAYSSTSGDTVDYSFGLVRFRDAAGQRTELDLEGGNIRIATEGPDFGVAEVKQYLAQAALGQIPVDYSTDNRQLGIPLVLGDSITGSATFEQARTALEQKVARFQDEGGWLKFQTITAGSFYIDCIGASLAQGKGSLPILSDVDPDVVLTLDYIPEIYGEESAIVWGS